MKRIEKEREGKKMKKGILVNLILCVLLISSILLISSCGTGEVEEAPSVTSIDIKLSIDYPKKSNVADIQQVPFKIEEDTTVLQAIQLYGNVNDISILVDTTHSTLEGINNVANHVLIKDAEWEFKINDKYVSKSESEYVLKSGDSVEFIYVK